MKKEDSDPSDAEWADTVEWPEEDWGDDYWDETGSENGYF